MNGNISQEKQLTFNKITNFNSHRSNNKNYKKNSQIKLFLRYNLVINRVIQFYKHKNNKKNITIIMIRLHHYLKEDFNIKKESIASLKVIKN
jgi:hypothetical protein